ncbi:MAG: PP0621 family protein [Pseudomonadales bacterium]
MGLIKLLILGVLVWLALNFWRRAQNAKSRSAGSSAPHDTPPIMVRCARCQVHLPQDRALHVGDAWYCCAEHRDAKPD